MEVYQAKQWMRWCAVGLLISGCGMALGHALFGHTMVDVLYEGSTGTFLDGIIEGQNIHPLEHYYAVVDRLVLKASVALCLLAWGLLGFSCPSSTWVLGLLLATDLIFIILDVLYGAAAGFDHSDFSIGIEWGYAETFQYVKEFGLLVCFLLLFRHSPHVIFLGWQALFLYLLLDDSLSIHERLGRAIAQFFHLSPMAGLRARDFGELAVSAFFGSLILSLLSFGYYYAPHVLRRMSWHLFVLLSLLVLFGVIVDMVHMMMVPYQRMYAIFEVVEEGGEMVTMSAIAWYVHRLTTDSGLTPLHGHHVAESESGGLWRDV
jgi:hypothetical protein